jgi:hypothetical protein
MASVKKQIRMVILSSGKPIDYVQRYDGTYSPFYESDLEYFIYKQKRIWKEFLKSVFRKR